MIDSMLGPEDLFILNVWLHTSDSIQIIYLGFPSDLWVGILLQECEWVSELNNRNLCFFKAAKPTSTIGALKKHNCNRIRALVCGQVENVLTYLSIRVNFCTYSTILTHFLPLRSQYYDIFLKSPDSRHEKSLRSSVGSSVVKDNVKYSWMKMRYFWKIEKIIQIKMRYYLIFAPKDDIYISVNYITVLYRHRLLFSFARVHFVQSKSKILSREEKLQIVLL